VPEPSPRIESLSWGRVQVAGADAPYKDAKLFPGGSRPWDWRETGTQHSPGVQVADVEELVERGAEVVILSQGMYRRLQAPEETLQWLRQRGVEVHVSPTEEAVQRYNELAGRRPVGALIHSTC